ncbi:MAG: ABC transporter permease [Acidobacteriota bacterium]|nr:ABC transporter permease [Acidobacteriota bacterium]
MQNVFQDLRYGARTLWQKPGFALVAVLLLALGIGATTAIFTLINATLLKQLPYPNGERLVRVVNEERGKEGASKVSYPDFEDWRKQARGFEFMAAAGNVRLTATGGEGAESLVGEYVSADYFRLFGVAPLLGRAFDAAETEAQAGARQVVMLSEGYWQRRFGGDAAIIGKPLPTTVGVFEIVGVLPARFSGLLDRTDFWLPASASALVYPGWLQDRKRRWHSVVAKRQPEVTQAAAQAEMNLLAQQLEQAFPASNKNIGARVTAFDESLRARVQPGLLLLMTGAVFLLAVACTNVANLMLVRAGARRKELAIRAALGSSRHRLIALLLSESLLLSLAGGALGLLFAGWMSQLIATASAIDLPRYVQVGMDWRVLGAALLVTMLTTVGFGLVPALLASKTDLNLTLKESGRSTGARGSRVFGKLLVVGQVAISLMLLIGAGLVLVSYQRLQNFDPGFRAENLLALEINPRGPKYQQPAAHRELTRALDERLQRLPGITTAIAAPNLPPRTFWPFEARVEGGQASGAAQDETIRLELHRVTPEFFGVLNVPLLAGRNFDSQDHPDAPRVAVISQSTARRLWPGENALGKRLREADAKTEAEWITVIGVVGDVKYDGLRSDRGADLDLYLSLPQTSATYMTIAARTTLDKSAAIAAVRRELQAIDGDLPILEILTIEERFQKEHADTRFQAVLLGLFALLAFLLAAAGLYSTISYSVSRRQQELGIRLALGASSQQIIRLIVGEGLALVSGGVAAGLLLALLLTKLLASLLFGVSAQDPLTFVAASLLLSVVALLACYLPARRATKVDPLTALRQE